MVSKVISKNYLGDLFDTVTNENYENCFNDLNISDKYYKYEV